MNIEAIDDWLAIRRQLLEAEAAFTDLAIKAVNGAVSEEQLQQERERLEGMRLLCSAAYQRAFPPQRPQSA